jgi:hypothetical protein
MVVELTGPAASGDYDVAVAPPVLGGTSPGAATWPTTAALTGSWSKPANSVAETANEFGTAADSDIAPNIYMNSLFSSVKAPSFP